MRLGQRPRTVEGWIQRLLRENPPRSKSLMMTVFGDSIAPYASGIWLGDLIELLAPFGVNERLVRTSGFRLVEEGWLQSERQGRASRYGLTESGRQRVQHASRRIYDPPPRSWDGRWTVLLLPRTESGAAARLQLRRELGWEGFGMLAPGVFVHPAADRVSLREVLEPLGLADTAVVLEAATLPDIARRSDAVLVAECWSLAAVEERYAEFVETFSRVAEVLSADVEPQSAFVLQTLLIHAFRREVLHDPRLPAPLLPGDWPGHSAYALCREIYQGTYLRTREHLSGHLEGVKLEGKPRREVMRRLGGLG